MRVAEFEAVSRCAKQTTYGGVITSTGRSLILSKLIEDVCDRLAAGVPSVKILASCREKLTASYAEQSFIFQGQATQAAEDDVTKIERFCRFLQGNVKNILCANVPVSLTVSDGVTLETKASLIVKGKDEKVYAFVCRPGKNKLFSQKGRNFLSNPENDLTMLTVKGGLERTYPNVVCAVYFFTSSDDELGNITKDVNLNGTIGAQFFTVNYHSLYEKSGEFRFDDLSALARKSMDVHRDRMCEFCDFRSICQADKLVDEVSSEREEDEVKAYRIPSFTNPQLEAVETVNGPLLVCAPPGSGKTATIIGRIRYLIEKCGIPPQVMLVVTFTRKAADELRGRCASFLPENSMPQISTLHAFAYSVLKKHSQLLGMKELRLLTPDVELDLVKGLCAVYPAMRGFSTEMGLGAHGTYNTVLRHIKEYQKATAAGEENALEYLLSHDHDQVFVEFANIFADTIEAGEYITFDEQIQLCVKLFKEHPEVLKLYQNLCQYIMVDEFQDVNKEQVDMLYMLAAEHKNIMVVGDDDQSIYKFRGASASFMLDFPSVWGGKKIVLTDNFRSTQNIISSTSKLIEHNGERIHKEIRSGSGKEGHLPMVVRKDDPDTVGRLINDLVSKEGYRYGDIAILAMKNSTLEKIYSSAAYPCVLSKALLRQDAFFVFVYSVLRLWESRCEDSYAFVQFLELFNLSELAERGNGEHSVYRATIAKNGLPDVCAGESVFGEGKLVKPLSLLSDMFAVLDTGIDLSEFLSLVRLQLGWDKTDAPAVLLELLEQQNITSFEDCIRMMRGIVEYEDTRRVEVTIGDRVGLYTCHDSKGKEFPIVVLINDVSDDTEEGRRVFYVATTRPKERLYILQGSKCKVNFVEELPHEEVPA